VGGGSYALRVPVSTNGTSIVDAFIQVPLCAGSSVNLAGSTISASVYLAGPQLGQWSSVAIGIPDNLNGPTMGPANHWFTVQGTISSTQVTDVAINLNVNGATDVAWTGIMYIDNVVISGT
jgi:hypothetical protein